MPNDFMLGLLRRFGIARNATVASQPEASVNEASADDLSEIPALVQAGRTAEAEVRLRDCLARNAGHVDALQYLGLICLQSGRHAEAVSRISAAARLGRG